MSKEGEVVCCPPTTAPTKPKVPHPVAAKEGYALAGRIEKLGNFDEVYVTGPAEAKHAIVVVYDIFGFWETTMRGSDILVDRLKHHSPTRVFMPDFFRGQPFPTDKDGDKDELKKFFGGTAKLEDRLEDAVKFAKFLKKEYSFASISILGYCWGGKITLLALHAHSPFDYGAVVHPAMIAPEDGDKLERPLAFYPSHDELKEVVEHIEKQLIEKPFAAKNEFHLYDTAYHGWAAARANLKDEEMRKLYYDIYHRLGDYFLRVQQ
ncbi:hypothetical protein Q5752_006008 [Cryptotrichosporon argae]